MLLGSHRGSDCSGRCRSRREDAVRMDDAALTALALRAREGDQEAASRFVRGTQQQVWRMLVALSDRGIAEDLTQETYARAFRALPGFRAESTVRAWLLSIARRVAADHLRAARARPRT